MVKHLCKQGWYRRTIFLGFALWTMPLLAHESQNILFLHSYHPDYLWTQQIMEGLEPVLEEGLDGHYHLFHEFLDTKKFPLEQTELAHVDLLGRKYGSVPLSLVLVSDEDAYAFYFRHREALFPGVPMFFCAVDRLDPAQDQSQGPHSGVMETLGLYQTLDLMLNHFPRAETYLILTDDRPGRRILLSQLENFRHESGREERIQILWGPGREELRQTLGDFSGAPLLYLGYFQIPGGGILGLTDSLGIIQEEGPRPLYSLWDDTLGQGVLGGYMNFGESQGVALGEMVLRYLQEGVPPQNQPIQTRGPGTYMADYRVMEILGLRPGDFPPSTRFVNAPDSTYRALQRFLLLSFLVIAILGIITASLVVNIRRRKRAETMARALKRAVDSTAHAVYLTRPDGSIFYVNPAFETLTGYSRDDVLGKNPRHFQSGLMPPGYYENLWQTILQGHVWREEVTNRRRDGSLYTAEQTISPLVDTEGTIEGFVAIQSDQSERIAFQDALRKSEQNYRLLAENATDLITVHRLNGNYVFLSPAVKDLLGFEAEELQGENCFRRFHREDLDRVLRYLRELPGDKSSHTRIEFRLQKKDGTWVWLESSARMAQSEGRPIFIAISRNIEERKQFETELVEARKRAEEADRTKGAFLANMSHEIRTPLNGIMGFARLISESSTDETLTRYSQLIEKSGSHLAELINDILDISKMEAGMLVLKPESVGPDTILQELHQLFQWKAQDTQVQLLLDLPGEGLPQVFMDPLRFRQILMNLVGNSVKFTSQGEVRIRARFKGSEVRGTLRGDLIVQVEDTGIGIPQDQLDHIFQAFRQVDSESKRKYGGTGLGLAISRRLAEQMGGSLEAQSEPGKGSCFTLTLKNVKAEAGEGNPLVNSGQPGMESLPMAESPENWLQAFQDKAGAQNWLERITREASRVRSRAVPDEIAEWAELILKDFVLEGVGPPKNHLERLAKAARQWDIVTMDSAWNQLFAFSQGLKEYLNESE